MGRKGPRAKTKTVLKPVNKKEQLGGMPKMKKDKNPNKNPPNAIFKNDHVDDMVIFENINIYIAINRGISKSIRHFIRHFIRHLTILCVT